MGDPASLSDRQRQILHLVAAGWTSPHIARHLGLSPRTVENHRAHACRRLGLRGNHPPLRWAPPHAGARPTEPIE